MLFNYGYCDIDVKWSIESNPQRFPCIYRVSNIKFSSKNNRDASKPSSNITATTHIQHFSPDSSTNTSQSPLYILYKFREPVRIRPLSLPHNLL